MVPGFSEKVRLSKILFFNWNEKKNWNQLYILTSALIQCLSYLEMTIEIRQVHKPFIKLPITLLFWHDVL